MLKLGSLLEDSCLVHWEHLLVKGIHSRTIRAHGLSYCCKEVVWISGDAELIISLKNYIFLIDDEVIVLCQFIASWCECFTAVNLNDRVHQIICVFNKFKESQKSMFIKDML